MRVLVVGSGGREHALVWALRRSPDVREIHVAPGNAGTADLAKNVPIKAEDVPALAAYAQEQAFDLTVVGPEMPLALGLSDMLRKQGLRVFGPDADAAQIESSKAYAKNFMRAHGIPTADYAVFDDYDQALSYLNRHPAPIVVKASGLAGGKGAFVCHSDTEAIGALDRIMVERAFGAAGDQVIIEEYLTGQEVSVLAFTDGLTVSPMVLAQDYKAAYDGDNGPNTGGMGTVAPVQWLDSTLLRRVVDEVLQPAVDAMREDGIPYVGVLYAGLMVSGNDYRVLEFNCRFGDPEAQVIVPLLETDLASVMQACVEGRLDQLNLSWANKAAVCVVMASRGYPNRYSEGLEIQGLDQAARLPDTVVFHAGTARAENRVVTAGGRVLGVTAWADELPGAVQRAYAAVEKIHWHGAMFRRDIGAKGLKPR